MLLTGRRQRFVAGADFVCVASYTLCKVIFYQDVEK